ncbi:hypothetical protein F5879DRAFT_802552 [Lentinula edodes]|nr:hypothetical protein F5879DRAFT_802552 [Lentinula edodes]KAJ3921280.1 hypothetical protein F5877DRAFT_36299 [Lentinula edodes]
MPANRGRKKKSSNVKRSLQSDLARDVENARGWAEIVQIIRDQHQIPDLFTKAGLKRVYLNFDQVFQQLDSTFQKYEDNDEIVGGVVGIYTQMCEDAVLRTKLCENGLLSRLFPLLKRDVCRQMALHTLVNIGHHGGTNVHAEIARQAPILVQTLLDHPEEHQTVEHIIVILSHSVGAAVNGDSQAPEMPEIHRSLDMRIILKTTIHHMRQLYASKTLIDHGNQLVFASAMHCSAAFRSEPDLDKFLVAGLKSKNWGLRGSCLGAMIRSYILSTVPDRPALGPAQLIQIFGSAWPPHLLEVMNQYGLSRCQTTQQRGHAMALSDAITGAHSRDHYILGGKLADLTLLTEFSLPATPMFPLSEIIPRCVEALRARGTAADTDKADILEMKYLIRLQDWDGIKSKAQQFLARNPDSAYTFYALTLRPGSEDGLRAAKKGLKCKENNTTPYLYFQLLRRAIELAADLGVCYFQEYDQHGRMMWEEAIAFLMSALEDSKTFIEQAPPDNPYMMAILHWNIVLTITMEGPNADLKMVEGARKKLKISEEISEHLRSPILYTQTYATQMLVVDLYAEAEKDWAAGIKLMDERLDEQIPPPDFPKKAEDELTAWLNDMSLKKFTCSSATPKVNVKDLWYKQCSWCRNPSAVLRKCSGCESARYCDSQCQKAHWSNHKKECKARISGS